MQWLFPFAVSLHNAEEAIFMPPWVSAHRGQIPLHPSAATIRMGLLLLTLGAFAVTALSAKRGKASVWSYLLFGYAAAMLANVFVPHLPATIVFRAYTPGVVTAVLINLPVMSWLLLKALRERWVSGWKAVFYGVVVPIALAGLIAVCFRGGME
jgi:hypothetical protein